MFKPKKELKGLTLYYFTTCPYCIKVWVFLEIKRLKIASKNIHEKDSYKEELIEGGGKKQVPCLKIDKEDRSSQWLYESNDIIKYLSSYSVE